MRSLCRVVNLRGVRAVLIVQKVTPSGSSWSFNPDKHLPLDRLPSLWMPLINSLNASCNSNHSEAVMGRCHQQFLPPSLNLDRFPRQPRRLRVDLPVDDLPLIPARNETKRLTKYLRLWQKMSFDDINKQVFRENNPRAWVSPPLLLINRVVDIPCLS